MKRNETKVTIIITGLLFCLVLLCGGCRASRSSVVQHTDANHRLITADSLAAVAVAQMACTAIDTILFSGTDSIRIHEVTVTDTTGRTIRTRTIERVATANRQQSSLVRTLSDSASQTTVTAHQDRQDQTVQTTRQTQATRTKDPWFLVLIISLIILNITLILWPPKKK